MPNLDQLHRRLSAAEDQLRAYRRKIDRMYLRRPAGGGGVEVNVLSAIAGTDTVYSSGGHTVTGIVNTNVLAVPSATPSLGTPVVGLGTAKLNAGATVWIAVTALGESDVSTWVANGHGGIVTMRSVSVPITGDPDGATAPVWLLWVL